jgi:SpoVK/Ycf46/Vps4 family AAA+-type ATPase
MGIFVAEGHVDSGRIAFTINRNEEEFRKIIIEKMKKCFGLENYKITIPRKKNSIRIRFSNAELSRWFDKYHKKEIPPEILLSPNDVAAAFLRGLFEGDGSPYFVTKKRIREYGSKVYKHLEAQRTVSLKSSSRLLLEQVQVLLLRWGIVGRIYEYESNRGGYSKVGYVLLIRGKQNLELFCKHIGFLSTQKTAKLLQCVKSYRRNLKMHLPREFERIREIKRINEWIRVYDFEIPSTHSFFTNGILSHNTGKTLLAKAVANESGANFISISGPEIFSKWYGQSLPPTERIFSIQNSVASIQEIGKVVKEKNSTHVISFDENGKNKISKIASFIEHNSNGSKILEVKTATGRKIRVTDYHSLFTLKDGKIVDVKTSELVPGKSYIAIPLSLPAVESISQINLLEFLKDEDYGLRIRNTGLIKKAVRKLGIRKSAEILGVKEKYVYDILSKNVSIPAKKFLELMKAANIQVNPEEIYLSKYNKKEFPAIVKFDKDFSLLMGLWLAEGDYNKSSVRIHNTLLEVRNFVKSFCEKFKIHATFYKGGITINSEVLKIIFEKIIGLKGGDATKKFVPPIVFSLKKSSLAYLLKGYFTGDGSIYPNQRGVFTIEATTYSEKLANDILYLLLYFGIVASDSHNEKSKRHRILIRGIKNFRKFKKIGFLDEHRNKKIEEYLKSRKWERSDQIPIWDGLREILKAHMHEWKNSSTIGRDMLLKLLKKIDPTKKKYLDIWKIAEAEIYWDKVISIKPIEYDGPVFDISVNPSENFVGGFGGIFAHNTEENLRKIFEEAEKNAPSIIFIDEIDAIAPKREEVTGEVERRTVAQLLALMDGLKKRGKVIVIAATNRPHSLDPALRRAGRFDREIEFPVPDRNGRLEILKIHTRNMPLAKDVDLEHIADITHGYVGADIMALCKEAAMAALRRVLPEIKWKEKEGELPKEVLEKLVVTKADFDAALQVVEPSAMREVLIEVPKVKWEDIGGLDDVKQQLREMIEWPLKLPESFKRLGIKPPKGILLYGPPGCGKTLLAQAVANEAGVNFISVKGPEVYSMWVGESERKIRELFRRARQVAPSIIFLDEIDALAPRRGYYTGTRVTETVVSQLLTELSGIEELKGVVVIATTNRPDLIDPALLRPGRIDRHVLVPPPDAKTRLKIFQVHTRKQPLAKDVDLEELVKRTENYSGADIEAVCREAAMNALRENINAKEIKMRHFEQALEKVKPSLTKEIIEYYEQFAERQKKAVKEEAPPPYIG